MPSAGSEPSIPADVRLRPHGHRNRPIQTYMSEIKQVGYVKISVVVIQSSKNGFGIYSYLNVILERF